VRKFVMIEEYHVTVFMPRGLPEAEEDAIRQALDDARFLADLRRALRIVFQKYVALGNVKIKLSR
jgi:hypothetical protein